MSKERKSDYLCLYLISLSFIFRYQISKICVTILSCRLEHPNTFFNRNFIMENEICQSVPSGIFLSGVIIPLLCLLVHVCSELFVRSLGLSVVVGAPVCRRRCVVVARRSIPRWFWLFWLLNLWFRSVVVPISLSHSYLQKPVLLIKSCLTLVNRSVIGQLMAYCPIIFNGSVLLISFCEPLMIGYHVVLFRDF